MNELGSTAPDPCPPIDSLGDLITQQQLADFFGVTVATVRDWMRGHKGRPPLPYLRITKAPLFSRHQVAWWLRKVQEQGDPMMVNVRRARREQGTQ